jgi:predicted nucleotide-binding protein
MTTIEIILTATMVATTIASTIINRFQNVLVNLYKKKFFEMHSHNRELVKYCLGHIIKEAIENEHYDTAARCHTILEKMKNDER